MYAPESWQEPVGLPTCMRQNKHLQFRNAMQTPGVKVKPSCPRWCFHRETESVSPWGGCGMGGSGLVPGGALCPLPTPCSPLGLLHGACSCFPDCVTWKVATMNTEAQAAMARWTAMRHPWGLSAPGHVCEPWFRNTGWRVGRLRGFSLGSVLQRPPKGPKIDWGLLTEGHAAGSTSGALR